MAKVPVINLRKGHAVNYNNDVCVVVSMEHKCPPRMASYVQMSIRSISTKKVYNLRLTSNESLEGVNLAREEYEFSYIDGMGYHFMNPDTYEDITVSPEIVEPVKDYLMEGNIYILLFTDETVVSVELPAAITMEVAEAPEGVKGDSANNVYKSARMTTGNSSPSFCSLKSPVRFVRMGLFSCRNPCPFSCFRKRAVTFPRGMEWFLYGGNPFSGKCERSLFRISGAAAVCPDLRRWRPGPGSG